MKGDHKGGAKSAITKIIESPATDPTKKIPLRKVESVISFNSDSELKPHKVSNSASGVMKGKGGTLRNTGKGY